MEVQQTRDAYDAIAGHWASEAFHAENGIAQHRRALQFVPDRADGEPRAALDVGCGSNGRIIDLLLEGGFAPQGVDLSGEMLALARRRHPAITFHQADICQWELLQTYDFISAWDSIWHVPLAHQTGVLQKLCDGLAPGGVLIFTAGGTDAPGELTNDFHGVPLYHATLGVPQLLRVIDETNCICRHLEYDQWPEVHLYLIVQKPSLES